MVRAPEEMVNYASQWKVSVDELEQKAGEMVNAAVYFTAGAQHPPKQVKFDFYYMHCVTSSIFYSTFLKQDWIPDAVKARTLEWKGRMDLCMYASRRSPEPLMREVEGYQPRCSRDRWDDVFERFKRHEDDGHAAKLVRALAHGEQLCAGYKDNETFRIRQDMWVQLGHMGITTSVAC